MSLDTIPSDWLTLAEEQAKHLGTLLEMNNVVGVALGHRSQGGEETDEPAIGVLVSHKVAPDMLASEDMVPKRLGSAATDVLEVGDIFAGTGVTAEVPARTEAETDEGNFGDTTAQATFSPSLTRRMRPCPGGFSVGHHKVTAGTLGTCCYDLSPFPSMPRRYYLLSNNHVLANSNDARIGDPILQPGRIDGGMSPRDVIARLSRFVPIKYHTPTSKPCNYVDAAIAEGSLQDLNRQVYWGGHVQRLYTAPTPGDIVQKTGRTTGFTTGKVTHINATIDVNYGSGRVARFCRQIVTNDMSRGGDSGSLVTNLDEEGVGLLFAGSATHTIINHLHLVQRLLRVRVTEK